MGTLVTVTTAFSGVSFVVYGIICLASDSMRAEFERFRLPRCRVLVGWLEILGGLAQLLSYVLQPLGLLGSGGLCLLMAMGVVTRRRIGDSLRATSPALAFMVINAFLFAAFLKP